MYFRNDIFFTKQAWQKKNTCFLWLKKKNKSFFSKIVNVYSAESLFLLRVSPPPLGYGPGFISVNFEIFFVNGDRYCLLSMINCLNTTGTISSIQQNILCF